MIARYVLHVEAHRGHRPRVSLRRASRHGDRVVDGGIPGTLEACPQCSGDGFLHRPGRDLTALERIRYAVAAGIGVPPRLLGLPTLMPAPTNVSAPPAPDQDVRAVPSPAGKNDQAPPLPFLSVDDPDRLRAERDEARDLLEALQAEVYALRLAAEAVDGSRLSRQGVTTATAPDEAARAHPLHRVIADALRNPTGRHGFGPATRIWGRGSTASQQTGASGNVWAGDPDDVADGILRAIAAAPAGPVTRDAWARLRAEVAVVAEPRTCTATVASYWDDYDTSPCGKPAEVEVFTTAGRWEPHCTSHGPGRGVMANRIRPLSVDVTAPGGGA